jgi:dCTP deaminase
LEITGKIINRTRQISIKFDKEGNMSVLSDVRLLEKIYDKELKIEPFIYERIQPSSIDLTLDNKIKVPKDGIEINAFDRDIENYFEDRTLDEYNLAPGDFVVGQIKEKIGLSKRLVGHIDNRNSLIRLGINVGLSSYINPGYYGQLPIAIHNLGKFNIDLTPGMRICQLVVSDVHPASETDYSKRKDAKYLGESEVGLSKLYMDSEVAEYLASYNRESHKGINKKEFIEFLEERAKRKSSDIIRELSDGERKMLGLH